MPEPVRTAVFRIPVTYRRATTVSTWLCLLTAVALVTGLATTGRLALATIATPLVVLGVIGVWLATRLPDELRTNGLLLRVTRGATSRDVAVSDISIIGRELVSGMGRIRLASGGSVWVPTGTGWPDFVAAMRLPAGRCQAGITQPSVWRDGLAFSRHQHLSWVELELSEA